MAEPAKAFVIDTERCVGHGRCYTMAPDDFDADENGYGIVLGTIDAGRSSAEIDDVVGACPEEAISVQATTE